MRRLTQTINALRGHLAEYDVGRSARQGPDRADWPTRTRACGGAAGLGRLLLGRIDELEDKETARLLTIPGIGPILAMALQAIAPPSGGWCRAADREGDPGPCAQASHPRGPASGRRADAQGAPGQFRRSEGRVDPQWPQDPPRATAPAGGDGPQAQDQAHRGADPGA